MIKLDLNQVDSILRERLEACGREVITREMEHLQTALYVMCGGGWLGEVCAKQSEAFYSDSRNGKLPYPSKEVAQALSVFKIYLRVLGVVPPRRTVFHNSGIF